MSNRSTRWDIRHIGNLDDRRVVITGGNSGIGLETAIYLCEAGAEVVLACRNLEKADAACDKIRQHVPHARVESQLLDLADLRSVRDFVDDYTSSAQSLDILIDNAGVMMTPKQQTADGFELQFGTNHLGHFVLTLGLLPVLAQSKAPRIVVVSSHMHAMGRIDFDNLNAEKGYNPASAYSGSKLANLLFVLELHRLLGEVDSPIRVVAAHPGYCDTELQERARDRGSKIIGNAMILSARLLAQSPQMGALPTVRAAVDADLVGGEYIGPRSLFGTRGYPAPTWRAPQAKDHATARRLWKRSEELTGTRWEPSLVIA